MPRISRPMVYLVFRQLCTRAGMLCLDALNPDDRKDAAGWRLCYRSRRYRIEHINRYEYVSYPMGQLLRPAREMYFTMSFTIHVIESMELLETERRLKL